MAKKLILDEYEQEIEDNFETYKPIKNREQEMAMIVHAAKMHNKIKKSITLRVHARDLEVMRLKSARLGIPYQTYINMLIHKDASSGLDYAV
jgi:predicted DNA binding CopG/RHH family protein